MCSLLTRFVALVLLPGLLLEPSFAAALTQGVATDHPVLTSLNSLYTRQALTLRLAAQQQAVVGGGPHAKVSHWAGERNWPGASPTLRVSRSSIARVSGSGFVRDTHQGFDGSAPARGMIRGHADQEVRLHRQSAPHFSVRTGDGRHVSLIEVLEQLFEAIQNERMVEGRIDFTLDEIEERFNAQFTWEGQSALRKNISRCFSMAISKERPLGVGVMFGEGNGHYYVLKGNSQEPAPIPSALLQVPKPKTPVPDFRAQHLQELQTGISAIEEHIHLHGPPVGFHSLLKDILISLVRLSFQDDRYLRSHNIVHDALQPDGMRQNGIFWNQSIGWQAAKELIDSIKNELPKEKTDAHPAQGQQGERNWPGASPTLRASRPSISQVSGTGFVREAHQGFDGAPLARGMIRGHADRPTGRQLALLKARRLDGTPLSMRDVIDELVREFKKETPPNKPVEFDLDKLVRRFSLAYIWTGRMALRTALSVTMSIISRDDGRLIAEGYVQPGIRAEDYSWSQTKPVPRRRDIWREEKAFSAPLSYEQIESVRLQDRSELQRLLAMAEDIVAKRLSVVEFHQVLESIRVLLIRLNAPNTYYAKSHHAVTQALQWPARAFLRQHWIYARGFEIAHELLQNVRDDLAKDGAASTSNSPEGARDKRFTPLGTASLRNENIRDGQRNTFMGTSFMPGFMRGHQGHSRKLVAAA